MSIAEKLTAVAQNQQAVFDAGKRAEYHRFWDAFQMNGTLREYRNAFSSKGWNKDTFYPKYDIRSGNCGHATFFYFNIDREQFDLAQRLEECGVQYDSSESIYMDSTFYMACVTRLPVISAVSATQWGLRDTFSYSPVVTIDKLILRDDGTTKFSTPFNQCANLKNIVIEGVIGQNGFDMQHATQLTGASIESIINALSDTANGLTVTFSRQAVETAFGSTEAAEWTGLVGTKSNWTIKLV